MPEKIKPVIIEQLFDVSIKAVWKALSNVQLMRLWYFDNIHAFVDKVGFETRFTVQNNEKSFIHLWKVFEVIPNKIITYN